MCPYAYVNEHDRRLKCKLQNAGNSYKYCGYQRFCNTQKEWVNTYKMSRCVIRKGGMMDSLENKIEENIIKEESKEVQSFDEQPKATEEEIVLSKDISDSKEIKNDTKKATKKDKKDYVKNQSADTKQKTKVCKKKFFSKGKLYFTFDNFDLEIPMSYKDSKKDEFTVTYIGEIGKAGFKVISVK